MKRAKDVIILSITSKTTDLIYPEKNLGERYKIVQRVLDEECSFDLEQIQSRHLLEIGKEVAALFFQRKGKLARPLASLQK